MTDRDMRLREKQSLFARLVPLLLSYMDAIGYEATLGEVERHPDATWGHPRSNHKNRLAIDVHLFLDGRYLTRTEDHRRFGEFWESLHPLCTWGGRFGESEPGAGDGNDGNHYSLMHNGVR